MKPNPIPDAGKYVFKDDFIERYSKLTDFKKFKEYSLAFIRKAIRINTLKISIEECTSRLKNKGWDTEQIPWCNEGFWIEHKERRDIGNLWEHHLGYIYVQEAASMIPPIVLGPQPHESVLDISAAPGSKATQIAQLMNNTGVLVANDYKAARLAALGVNVQRVSALNTIVTFMTGQGMRNMQFDHILVDAPCSGTGTIGKSLKTITMWNPSTVKRLARQQTQLVETAWKLLKKGGTLVYSTCTLEPEEDEGIISAFVQNHNDANLDKIKDSELPGLKRSPAVAEFEGTRYAPEIKNCLRLWPQDNYTEGFFVARILKRG
ncbi:RsmB/NOP family class I SAM-dependent RNA methyltransferase [Candidatus Woesearchaeota archaeon]|nr:RsmB/NOP family class I SAM-dependent RNA methyltransferase [Candidatus Woesearchaeota archaeon]